MKSKLAIVISHPIQYNAPWFRLLTERNNISIKVFYTLDEPAKGIIEDPGFGRKIEWDIPLLEGYEYEYVKNNSKTPGTRNYGGIVNPTLVARIEEWSPSAVLVFGWNFNSHLKCIRYFHKKIPVFFRGDSTLLNESSGVKKLLRKAILSWVYKHIDIAFYVGKNNKDYFLRHGLKDYQLVYAPHAIDNYRFMEPAAKYDEAANDWRTSLGIPDNHLVVLYAGKFEAVKNVTILLDAANILKDEAISFVLAGNGPLEEKLKSMAGNNIHFIGFQNQLQMPILYRIADVFALPSISETWGLGVNEAMACSRAILVSDHCGCAVDLVKDNINGYKFISEDLKDFVSKINLLNKKRMSIKEMFVKSKDIIQDFSFDKIAVSIEESVLKQGGH